MNNAKLAKVGDFLFNFARKTITDKKSESTTMKTLPFLALSAALALSAFAAAEAEAQTIKPEDVSVAKYKDNKRAAVSLTFDDGNLDNATMVAPELEKRGLRGTFWIVANVVGDEDPEQPRVTWDQLRQMAAAGHEISNHTWDHRKTVNLSYDEFRRGVEMCDSAIEANIGERPVTFCYPHNYVDPEVFRIASKGRVGTRIRTVGIGQKNNHSTAESITAWLNKTIADGDWGVTMTHGIVKGWDTWDDPQVLWNFFDQLKESQDSVWVAPFRNVAAYDRLRRDFDYYVKSKNGTTTIIPMSPLDPELFNEPLTMLVRGDWTAGLPSISQDGKNLEARIDAEGVLVFDINPVGGNVKISAR